MNKGNVNEIVPGKSSKCKMLLKERNIPKQIENSYSKKISKTKSKKRIPDINYSQSVLTVENQNQNIKNNINLNCPIHTDITNSNSMTNKVKRYYFCPKDGKTVYKTCNNNSNHISSNKVTAVHKLKNVIGPPVNEIKNNWMNTQKIIINHPFNNTKNSSSKLYKKDNSVNNIINNSVNENFYICKNESTNIIRNIKNNYKLHQSSSSIPFAQQNYPIQLSNFKRHTDSLIQIDQNYHNESKSHYIYANISHNNNFINNNLGYGYISLEEYKTNNNKFNNKNRNFSSSSVTKRGASPRNNRRKTSNKKDIRGNTKRCQLNFYQDNKNLNFNNSHVSTKNISLRTQKNLTSFSSLENKENNNNCIILETKHSIRKSKSKAKNKNKNNKTEENEIESIRIIGMKNVKHKRWDSIVENDNNETLTINQLDSRNKCPNIVKITDIVKGKNNTENNKTLILNDNISNDNYNINTIKNMNDICTISKVKNQTQNILEKNKVFYNNNKQPTDNISNENKNKLKKNITQNYINDIFQNNDTIKNNTVNNFNPKKKSTPNLNTPNNYIIKTNHTDNNKFANFVQSEKKTENEKENPLKINKPKNNIKELKNNIFEFPSQKIINHQESSKKSEKNIEEETETIIYSKEASTVFDDIPRNNNLYNNYNNNIYQNHINKNNNLNNESKILDNKNLKDISINSSYNLKMCKSLTQAGKERSGHRKKNQDNFIIEKNLNNIIGFNLFGVLDGHGVNGHYASEFASKYLKKKFEEISENFQETESLYKELTKNEHQKIIDIFLETDKQIIDQKRFDISLSGTTCVLVIQLGDHLICANIGDSRAILIYDENKIKILSNDCKPDLEEEKKRINMMGGVVERSKLLDGEKIGPYRVYIKNEEQPGLAMSRSFGDKKAKSCGVIPYPDFIEYNVCNDTKYMVICSDGVWDFLSNEDVRDIGNKYYDKNNIDSFCQELLKTATKLWEKEENVIDDITIVVVFF